jgi:molybdopterin-guanine dinucleotide biosynthesis protein A
MTRRDLAVIVVAAGRGERLKASAPKAFVEINGRTILEHSLSPLSALAELSQVVIAAPSSHLAEATEIANAVLNTDATLDVVVGGDTRQQSIANALAVVADDVEIVLSELLKQFAQATLRLFQHSKSQTPSSAFLAKTFSKPLIALHCAARKHLRALSRLT